MLARELASRSLKNARVPSMRLPAAASAIAPMKPMRSHHGWLALVCVLWFAPRPGARATPLPARGPPRAAWCPNLPTCAARGRAAGRSDIRNVPGPGDAERYCYLLADGTQSPTLRLHPGDLLILQTEQRADRYSRPAPRAHARHAAPARAAGDRPVHQRRDDAHRHQPALPRADGAAACATRTRC